MNPMLTWKQLLKRLNGPHIHIDTAAQEFPWTLLSPGYSCVRGTTDPVITHLDIVAQETPWTLYSPGYSCSRGFMDTVISHTWIELRKRHPRPCKHSPGYSCSRGFMDTVTSHTWIELRKRLPRPCKHSPGYSCSRGSTNPVKHPYEYMDPDTLLQEFPRTWIQLINCFKERGQNRTYC